MRETHPETTDAQWGAFAPLSPRGQERRAEILAAMERTSQRRRGRARSIRTAAAFAVCSSAALLAWHALTPAQLQPVIVVHPGTTPDPVPHPALPADNSAPQQKQAVVVAEYFGTQRGVADRFSSTPFQRRLVTAERLTDGSLSRVLAEQTAYGVAEVQGRVLVLNNQPSPAATARVH